MAAQAGLRLFLAYQITEPEAQESIDLAPVAEAVVVAAVTLVPWLQSQPEPRSVTSSEAEVKVARIPQQATGSKARYASPTHYRQ